MAGQIFGTLVLVLEFLWLQVRTYAEVLRSLYLTFVPPPEKSVAGEIVLVSGLSDSTVSVVRRPKPGDVSTEDASRAPTPCSLWQ